MLQTDVNILILILFVKLTMHDDYNNTVTYNNNCYELHRLNRHHSVVDTSCAASKQNLRNNYLHVSYSVNNFNFKMFFF